MSEEKVELLIDSVNEPLRPVVNEDILKKTKGMKVPVSSIADALKGPEVEKPAK